MLPCHLSIICQQKSFLKLTVINDDHTTPPHHCLCSSVFFMDWNEMKWKRLCGRWFLKAWEVDRSMRSLFCSTTTNGFFYIHTYKNFLNYSFSGLSRVTTHWHPTAHVEVKGERKMCVCMCIVLPCVLLTTLRIEWSL